MKIRFVYAKINSKLYHRRSRQPHAGQQGIQKPRLVQRAREAIQNQPAGIQFLAQPARNGGTDQLVVHQRPGGQNPPQLAAFRRLSLRFRAQNLSGG